MSLQESFESFIQSRVYLKNCTLKTVRSYRQAFRAFQMAGGEDSVENLTQASLNGFVVHMRGRGLSAGSCNVYILAVNSWLSWMHEEGDCSKHLRISQLRQEHRVLEVFSEAQMRQILSVRPRRFTEWRTYALMSTLVDTGCRIDELLTVHYDRVDLDNLLITVVGKGRKERKVPFSLELRKVLFRFSQKKQRWGIPDGAVFCTHRGGRLMYSNVYRDIRKFCRALGIKGVRISPHTFRHFFAVSYIRNGGDIYTLSRILGHQAVSTTQIYLRTMDVEQLAEIHSRFSPLGRLNAVNIGQIKRRQEPGGPK